VTSGCRRGGQRSPGSEVGRPSSLRGLRLWREGLVEQPHTQQRMGMLGAQREGQGYIALRRGHDAGQIDAMRQAGRRPDATADATESGRPPARGGAVIQRPLRRSAQRPANGKRLHPAVRRGRPIGCSTPGPRDADALLPLPAGRLSSAMSRCGVASASDAEKGAAEPTELQSREVGRLLDAASKARRISSALPGAC
jgi:hypothetical protein